MSFVDDQDGQRAAWAHELFTRTAEPRDLTIVRVSSVHNVSVFQNEPALEKHIFRLAIAAIFRFRRQLVQGLWNLKVAS